MYAQQDFPPPTHSRRPTRSGPSWLLIGGALAVGITALLIALGLLVAVWYWTSDPTPGQATASTVAAGAVLDGAPVVDSTSGRVASGVMVADVPVGGLPVDGIGAVLAQHDFGARPITLTDDNRSWTLTLTELGASVNLPATVLAVENAAPGAVIQPVYAIDLNVTQNALIALSEQANIDAVPGNSPQIGRTINIPTVLNHLHQNLDAELADGVLELDMIVTQPPALEPVQQYTGATTVHIVEPGQELALIARLYGVNMQDIVALNNIANPDLLYIGQELIIPAAGLYTPVNTPAAPTGSGKSIVVSTTDQRIYAYENGQLVHSYLVSTGRTETPTVLGDYKIYVKYTADDMSGPDYFLPQVPYTMYFYQGYGIHGTYWHNSFGRPMSHGCVNLPVDQAQWFFQWAEVGTPVRVI
ncbi:MAG: L,D-transpeptidase family protein [Anaerolineae bacterium]|nr:L,D-transpeptidase family protein [Anaerolineae bacterium]